jgi:predicted RNA polymerase sigma factor
VLLYDILLYLAPSPLTCLHRCIARRYTAGPAAALAEANTLAADLDRYHIFHATRADLLQSLGRTDEARAANRCALELTGNPAEQAVLRRRLDWGDDDG